MDELTDKQRLFVSHYVACLNATRAAELAGYAGSRNVLAVTGHENLRNPKIRAEIDAALAEAAMPASEVLARLTAQARGTLADVIRPRGRGYGIDFKHAEEMGALDLVKKYTKTDKSVSVELYDAQAALALLAKHHKLLVDRTELTGRDGDPLIVQVKYADPDTNPS
jgi:phage terminase small subunit